MGDIPLDLAYLTAIWLETVFYGNNMLLFCSYLFIARYKRKYPLKRAIFITAILMFIFSTIHCSMGFARLIEGFIYLRDEPGGPGAFFSDISIPANVAKVVIHTINSVLGDSIVVWRCYHVWGKSWKICVVPVMLIVASAVCGIGQGIAFATAKSTHTAFGPAVERWNGLLFSLSLVTNIVATSLVAARIWYLGRRLHASGVTTSFKYRRVLAIVVESGAIYSSALIIEITLYLLHSNAFYIIYDPIAQLTAIVPTMIIVMSSLGLTSGELDTAARQQQGDHNSISAPRFALRTMVTTTSSTSTTAGYNYEICVAPVPRVDPKAGVSNTV